MRHHPLELMKQVVIKYLTFVFFLILWSSIVDAKKIVTEGWSHEELLQHAVHVTNTAKVSKPHVFLQSCRLARGLVVPLVRLFDHLKQGH